MKIVGLTGGIGSGKSTVGALFQELGVPVYNSDERAKQLMNTSKKIKKRLLDLFGSKAYIDNELNRAFIADKVFYDTKVLAQLNAIVHPAVRKDFVKWVKKQDTPYVVQETALLFENNAQEFYDKIVLVTAPKAMRIERILARDETTREKIIARMQNQLSDEIKIKFSDHRIENMDLKRTTLAVRKLHELFLADYE
jgi:dephospho-CoA kinase